MAERVHKEKQSQKHEDEVEQAAAPEKRDSKLSDDVDDILDEIDNVLEENAEEFVKNYVQKGGQ